MCTIFTDFPQPLAREFTFISSTTGMIDSWKCKVRSANFPDNEKSKYNLEQMYTYFKINLYIRLFQKTGAIQIPIEMHVSNTMERKRKK